MMDKVKRPALVANEPISPARQLKYLGTIIDNQLTIIRRVKYIYKGSVMTSITNSKDYNRIFIA